MDVGLLAPTLFNALRGCGCNQHHGGLSWNRTTDALELQVYNLLKRHVSYNPRYWSLRHEPRILRKSLLSGNTCPVLRKQMDSNHHEFYLYELAIRYVTILSYFHDVHVKATIPVILFNTSIYFVLGLVTIMYTPYMRKMNDSNVHRFYPDGFQDRCNTVMRIFHFNEPADSRRIELPLSRRQRVVLPLYYESFLDTVLRLPQTSH